MSNSFNNQDQPIMDLPIRNAADDKLGRAPVAQAFADSITTLDASNGLVVGIFAPWGYGKSSFINLMREQFEIVLGSTVIDFNPWMFSGSEQLVDIFLTQLAAELRLENDAKYGKIARRLAEYADVFKPAFQLIGGVPGGLFADAIGNGLQFAANSRSQETSVSSLRNKVTAELSMLQKPVVVTIDDIDRLTSSEIREIFRLVRLTASFPNIIYLLAFDRKRVELALAEDSISGRTYLEKIVQLGYDIPQIPDQLLQSQVLSELDKIIDPSMQIALDEDRWGDVFWNVIRPLFTNIRDIRRFVLSSGPTIKSLSSELDIIDLLAIEAFRVFRPEAFQRIIANRHAFTEKGSTFRDMNVAAQSIVQSLLDSNPSDESLLRALIKLIFPAADQYIGGSVNDAVTQGGWRTAHRIAHIDFLNVYLDRVAPNELLSFRLAESAFALFTDEAKLTEYLQSLPPTELWDTIECLMSFQSRFTHDMVLPASTSLLNLIDKIPRNTSPSFLTNGRPETLVARILIRLLRVVEGEDARVKLASAILNRTSTYSSMLFLIDLIGDRENIGLNLTSVSQASGLLETLVDLVGSTPPPHPQREWDACRVYKEIQNRKKGYFLTPTDDPFLLRSVLHSQLSVAKFQTPESTKIQIEKRIAWEPLVDIFGTEKALATVVDVVRKTCGNDEVLNLADRYLKGWRPKTF